MIYMTSKATLYKKIYNMLLIALIFDMGGGFGLKKVSFLLLGIYILLDTMKYRNYKITKSFIEVEGVIFIFLPIIMTLCSILFREVSISDSIGTISSYLIWIVYPLLIKIDSRNIINIFMKTMYYIAILMIFTFIIIYTLNLLGMDSYIWELNSFSNKYSLGFIGLKKINEFIVLPDIFYRFTFLIIPAAILWSNTDGGKKESIICLIAAIATTSTAVITFTILGIVWCSINKKVRMNNKVNFANTIFILILIFIISKYININEIIGFILDKFNSTSDSTSIKLLHIESTINAICEKPIFLLFGTGLGSSFYSKGANANVINVEVSHFNFIRQFGIIYASVFFIYIFNLCLRLKNTDRFGNKLMISIVCLFIACGTNPLLLSPVFFLILVIGRAYIEKYNLEIKAKFNERKISIL